MSLGRAHNGFLVHHLSERNHTVQQHLLGSQHLCDDLHAQTAVLNAATP